MIFALVVLILLVVFLAFFVGKNLSNICEHFWFFKTFDDVSSILLVLVAFAAGIIVALLCVVIFKMRADGDEIDRLERKNSRLLKKMKKADKSSVAGEIEDNSSRPETGHTGIFRRRKVSDTAVTRATLAKSSANSGKDSISS